MNREAWLQAAVAALTPLFTRLDHEVPAVHVSVGWASTRSAKTIGVCHTPESSADGVGQIFISPKLSDPAEVLGVLAHELVHAVNHKAGQTGHGKVFSAIAKPLGLEGKMTATTVGQALAGELKFIADDLGAYPHASLNRAVGKGGRSGAYVKLVCPDDGFTVRASKTMIEEHGEPACACGVTMTPE